MNEEKAVRSVLEDWAVNTRQGKQDLILKNHSPDVLIYDVLSPMKYEGVKVYRESWDEWQPKTQGESRFDLKDLKIKADSQLAFAHCFIACGGVQENGKSFEDLVRATFCLSKASGTWKIEHQHISKPIEMDRY